MRGQRGGLPVQPLGYVMFTKVILRQTEFFVLAQERKAKISCNGGRSVAKNLTARQDCILTSRKTDLRQKNETSARLKITFVDMTFPGQRPELPSLSRHFLLTTSQKRAPLPSDQFSKIPNVSQLNLIIFNLL